MDLGDCFQLIEAYSSKFSLPYFQYQIKRIFLGMILQDNSS